MAKKTIPEYALELITDLFGPRTEAAYRDLYFQATPAQIRNSLMKVLGDYLGSTEALYELNKFDAFVKSSPR